MKTLVILTLTLGAILRLHSQGYLLPNGVTSAGYSPLLGGYEIRVLQNPTNSDFTGFSLNPVGITHPGSSTNTFSLNFYLDEGVRVFQVSENAPIALQPILSQSYLELGGGTYVFEDSSPFYVGLYTSDQFPQNGVYPNPMFGWAQLVNNGGAIQLLDGQLAYGAGGIYAGTTTLIPIPEPTVLSWFGLGLLGLALNRRCQRTSIS